jgi:preprotein translocase subunit SecG
MIQDDIEKKINKNTDQKLREEMMQDLGTANTEMKKSTAYLVLSFFIFAIFIAIYFGKNSYLEKYLPQSFSSLENVSEQKETAFIETYEVIKGASKDMDANGLSGWRESIYKNIDPLNIPGNLSKDEEKNDININTNLTEMSAKDLYVASQYKKNNKDFNTESMIKSIEDNYLEALKPKRVDFINTVKDSNPEKVKEYGNIVASMFTGLLSNENFVELQELSEEDSDFAKTKSFERDVVEICLFAKKVENIPMAYIDMHKDFIYNCEYYDNIIVGIINNKNDSLRGVLSLKSHEVAVKNISENFSMYSKKILSTPKISYESSEYASVFYKLK